MDAIPAPLTTGALVLFTLVALAGVWLLLPASWRWPRPTRPAKSPDRHEPLPDREVEPAHIWTENAAPLVAQLRELRPDLAYLWAPRLADFLAVETRYRGTGKAIATDLRLRQTRVALVLMELHSMAPLGVLMIADQNNDVAISLFDHLKLPYAEVHPRDPRAVAKALTLFGLEAPMAAPVSGRARSNAPLSVQAAPSGPDATIPKPPKSAPKTKPSPKGKPGPKPATPNTATKASDPADNTMPLPFHARGEEPEDMFAAPASKKPAPPPPPAPPPAAETKSAAAANNPDIV